MKDKEDSKIIKIPEYMFDLTRVFERAEREEKIENNVKCIEDKNVVLQLYKNALKIAQDVNNQINYNEIIYYFLKNGYSVFALEHRGHGRSGYLGKDTSQIYVKDYNYYILDLKKFIDEIVVPDSGDKDLFLFAHSMGGGIAAKFLQDYPQYFDAAVLTGPMMDVNTGSFPKFIARPITWVMTNLGLGYSYAAGEEPYTDEYDFQGASTSSEARYSYTYNNIVNVSLNCERYTTKRSCHLATPF